MRSFEERKTEVLARSEAAIVKRKANIKKIKTAVSIFALCICIFAGYGIADNSPDITTKGILDSHPEEGLPCLPDGYKDHATPSKPEDGITSEVVSPNYTLDRSTAAIIKQQYAEKHANESSHGDVTADDILISNYKGTFNGAVVAMIDCSCATYSEAMHSEVIGGVTLTYSDGRSYKVWHEDEFYSLKEAFDNSVLTLEELEAIASK